MEKPNEFPGVPCVHAALEAHHGDREHAAQTLGVTRHVLTLWIGRHSELAEVWGKSEKTPKLPLNKEEAKCREVHPAIKDKNPEDFQQPMTATDRELALRAEHEKFLAKGLKGLRISKNAQEIAKGMADMTRLNMQDCLHLQSGGMIRTNLIIQDELDKVVVELASVRAKLPDATLTISTPSGTEEGTLKLLHERERVLLSTIVMMAECSRKGAQVGVEYIKATALLKQRAAGARSAKAGFSTPGKIIDLEVAQK
jgi:hypothetical protein